jgi:hypothetical protein
MKSNIFIYCDKFNQRQDVVICFHKKCKFLSKCKEIAEKREEIDNWYKKEEDKEEKPGKDTKKQGTKGVAPTSPPKSEG